ncbi:hypothetical protein ElyMa_004838700 [Elysia marginata]|uniref:Endonuclease/exonuclease/phosphatase domain-containing protein n=1 Tax=Elysia marginata TaxID=1093978 RepID=A0AAV4IMZ6_9GAST|nr:hypothetical protein ElyMa_004838700 [Elysia marginata]
MTGHHNLEIGILPRLLRRSTRDGRFSSLKQRTVCPGLSDDLQLVNDARKTAIIDRELAKRNIDIAALQETRLAASGSLKENEHTFSWQGLRPNKNNIHGVGIVVRNTILSSV